MTKEEVIDLMQSSESEKEWDENCDFVRREFNDDYPSFWFEAILQSGVAKRTLAKFGADADLHIKIL